MHDTAFEIGGLAIEIYCPVKEGEILEIGSLDVNGSLRNHGFACKRYVGLDFSPGQGVDYVIEDNGNWPVEDSSFDLVIASSVFEHDMAFWQTFVSMLRKVRPGGYVYLNAPANGWVHRYPLDCWRFYPDSGRALVSWAAAQGVEAKLVESFVAQRQGDVWNDLCAVFRREPASLDLPDTLINERVACKNVITWKSSEIALFDEKTEDMQIIEDQRAARSKADEELAAKALAMSVRENELMSTIEALSAEVSQLQRALDNAFELNRVSQREIVDLRVEVDQAHRHVFEVQQKCAANADKLALETAAQIKAALDDRKAMAIDLRQAIGEKREIEKRARRADSELADMAQRIKNNIVDQQHAIRKITWLTSLVEALRVAPAGWGVVAQRKRQKIVAKHLKAHAIFNGDLYLHRYPDVAAANIDPLTHYISHGMSEGRNINELEESS